MDAIKTVYSNNGLTGNTIFAPIVSTQGKAYTSGINGIFSDPDFDSPDFKMREVLKRNVWDFSVAKNYNDAIAINNLLLDADGKLRSWNDFKNEAQKIVGDSIKYLQTEYNTVVAGAQMSRVWQEIERDKAIFPFVQFAVVNDDRISDTCKPLKDVIVSVDDPMLRYYFPPNHFNCRTTVKKLRNAKPTEKYELPKIPESFKNNVGLSGKIFTNENPYIAHTPAKTLTLGNKFYNNDLRLSRYQNIEFEEKKINSGLLQIPINKRQYKHEEKKNLYALNILAKNGYKFRILPVIEDGSPNPDAFNLMTEKFVDIKVSESTNGKNIIQSGMKEASKQNAEELIIHLRNRPKSYRAMYHALKLTVQQNRSKNVEKIIVIFPNESIKQYSRKRFK